MNNFVIGLKRFFTNKNVITILLVIVILVVLYFGYSGSIKKKTDPVSVPVAKEKLLAKTKITADDIEYKEVANSMIDENVIINSNDLIGKYVNLNVTVPAGSVFYPDWIVEEKDLKGNWIEQLNYEKGELGYYLDTSVEATLGNNVLPGTYVDIYMGATDENGTVIFGKLMKNVKILVVHDADGNDVFADTEEVGSPSKLGFAVNQDYYTLLKKTEYLDIDLIIAPRGATVPSEDYVIVTSSTLRDYIDAQTITVEEDIVTKDTNKDNS